MTVEEYYAYAMTTEEEMLNSMFSDESLPGTYAIDGDKLIWDEYIEYDFTLSGDTLTIVDMVGVEMILTKEYQ